MDKLQPILKQKFWILLFLGLSLTFFGYFKSQSAINAATAAREEKIKSTLSGVPSGSEPNDTFVKHAQKINVDYKAQIDEAIKGLFAGQLKRMTWPAKIASDIPKDPEGITEYRASLKPETIRNYITIYPGLIEELWKKAEPVVEQPPRNPAAGGMGGPGGLGMAPGMDAGYPGGLPGAGGIGMAGGGGRAANTQLNTQLLNRAYANKNQKRPGARKGQTIMYGQPGFPALTWTPKVYVDRQAIPQKQLPKAAASETVWDCQEDIWFTELIFDAVRKRNQDADSPLTAQVRIISKLELRGGAGISEGGEDGGGDMGMDEMGMDGMGMDPGMGAEAGGMGTMEAGDGLMGGAGNVPAPPKVEFDPAEVFGSDLASVSMGGEEGGDMMGDMSAEAGAMGGMSGMAGMMGANAPTLRWVGPTDGVPYRERGFYLSVIIDQNRIPDFLVNLCDAAWPIKILRFQMGPNPYTTKAGMSQGMGGMMGSPMLSGGGMMPEMSSMAGLSGRGGAGGMDMMGMMGLGSSQSRYPGGPPQFAGTPTDPFAGSLNVPDLVQLDIAGIVTFYIPPSKAETGDEPAVDTPATNLEETESTETPAAPSATTASPEDLAPVDVSNPNGTPPATEMDAEPATTPQPNPPAAENPASEDSATESPKTETPAATSPDGTTEN